MPHEFEMSDLHDANGRDGSTHAGGHHGAVAGSVDANGSHRTPSASSASESLARLRIDIGHTRTKAGNADVFMTPSMRHRMYTAADGSEADTRAGSGDITDGHIALPPLSRLSTACYSVGHFLNDATASCWFSYLLLYLQQVQQLSGIEAGIVLFSGQLFDALATPTAGILSDRSSGMASLGLGRRKLWNLIGVVIVVLCFFFVFGMCLPCELTPGVPVSNLVKTATFAVFASMFNVGWAAVQVSHMAMVPELTNDENERVFLNSLRYAFTILANVYVFVIMWVVLHFMNGGSEDNKYSSATYSLLTYSVLAAGGLLSAMFMFGTREALVTPTYAALETKEPPPASPAFSADVLEMERNVVATTSVNSGTVAVVSGAATTTTTYEAAATSPVKASRRPDVGLAIARAEVMHWWHWLRLLDFYKVACVYMFTRLAVNVSQVYLSFFITLSLEMDQTALAVVPLIVYVSSLLATAGMKRISSILGRRNSMTIGAILFASGCVFMLFLRQSSANLIYVAALLLGAGSAITMVISVSLEADLVGRNVESAAFLYGAISFTDKLSNGVAVLTIQFLGDTLKDGSKADFVRYVNALVPLAAIVLAALVAWSIKFPKHLRGTMQKGRNMSSVGDGEGTVGAVAGAAVVGPARRSVKPRNTTLQRFMARVSTFTSINTRDSSEDSQNSAPLLAEEEGAADEDGETDEQVLRTTGSVNGFTVDKRRRVASQ